MNCRQIFLYSVLPAACAMLAACGGGGGGSGTTPTAVPTASAPPMIPLSNITFTPVATSGPQQILTAADGNVWFTEYYANAVVKLTPSGQMSSFPVPHFGTTIFGPGAIATANDGTLWITGPANTVDNVSLTGTTLSSTNVYVCCHRSGPTSIATSMDGKPWFEYPDGLGTSVGSLINGQLTTISVPLDAYAVNMVTGPDGNLWLTDSPNGVVRLSPASGAQTFFADPAKETTGQLASCPDGNLWTSVTLTQTGGVALERISPSGQYSVVPIPGFLASAYTSPAGESYHWTVDGIYCNKSGVYFTAIGNGPTKPFEMFNSVVTHAGFDGSVQEQMQVPNVVPQSTPPPTNITSLTQGSDGKIYMIDSSRQTIDVWTP